MIVLSILLAIVFCIIFCHFQAKYFRETRNHIKLFEDFFKRKMDYRTFTIEDDIPQIAEVGADDSDLNKLIAEINHYIVKTKGTTEFSVIQNKVERKLSMREGQASAKISFPTYIGLMGTFLGVLMGIFAFTLGLNDKDVISNDSIQSLLAGVIVSMFTSGVGLFLSTRNTAKLGDVKKSVEEDKNEFYDFVQTELMPSIDTSLSSAIAKLHETVDNFEPTFNNVITRFQQTFDRCTQAFGDNFEKNVRTISNAIIAMGNNIDKINKNIKLQEKILSTLRSGEIVRGMDKYVEAAERFTLVTGAIDKFEETRQLMLNAAHEAIAIQQSYDESLRVPLQVASKINMILDRITSFEQSLKDLGESLRDREVLGDDIIKAIRRQVNSIQQRNEIANRYLETADGKLEDLFIEQTKFISLLNDRYRDAIEGHIEGFERMIAEQTAQIDTQHNQFIASLQEKFNVEEVRQEFTNLRKLEQIEKKLAELTGKIVQPSNLATMQSEMKVVESQLNNLRSELESINKNTKGRSIFSFGARKS